MELEDQVCSKRTSWNKGKSGYHMPLRGGGYHAIHKWLYKHFGRATVCESPFCNGMSKIFQWCKIRGKEYEHKRGNFVRLCQSCHRNYDDTSEWRGNIANREYGKHSEETKRKISESMKRYRKETPPWNSKNKL